MKRIVALALIAAAATLAGCGTSPTANEGFRQALNVAKRAVTRAQTTPTPVTEEQINAVLAQTDMPLALAIVEKTGTQAVLGEIARNGRYATFANAERQVIVLRDGFVTATRGLGADLMSSDSAALERLVRSRSAGQAAYSLRFLNGEDVETTVTVTCTTTPGGEAPVKLGTVNTTGRIVQAACTGDGPGFTNVYIVGADGYVLGAQSWIGEINGNLSTQILRR